MLEQGDVAGQQSAQDEAGIELATFAQMLDQWRHLGARRERRKRHRRLLAGVARDAFGATGLEPFPRGHEARQRLRELGDQRLARRRRQILACEQRLADRAEMSEALDEAVERERRDLGARVLDHHQAGLRRADLGDGGRHRGSESPTVRDRELRRRRPGRHRIDEIGLDQERRMLQHPTRDLGLIDRQAKDHHQRRVLTEGKRPRERRAHQRRWIVERHDQRPFASGAIVG